MRQTMIGLFGTLVCFLLAVPAFAREITVRTYPELRSACQSARPGDVITLTPGVYTIIGATRISVDNRPGPVTVRGATGQPGDVIIEGAGQDDETVGMVFDLTNSARWTFANFTTRRTYWHGFKFNGSSTDCVIRNVTMRDHGEGGVKGTWSPGTYPDRLRIENCDIGYTRRTGGTRGVVEGIDGVAVRDWIVTGCRFVNVQKNGAPAYGVFTKGNAGGTVIEKCRFENCFIGASFGGGGTGPGLFRDGDTTFEHRGGLIRNCVFVRCSDAGIYLNKSHGAQILGNTLFECGLTIQLRYPETTANVADNLLCLASDALGEPPVRVRDGATLLSNRANLVAQDSVFIRTGGPDADVNLHLRPYTFQLRGITLLELRTDLDGRLRSTTAPTVGAYEAAPVVR